jgi:hypothetical protein
MNCVDVCQVVRFHQYMHIPLYEKIPVFKLLMRLPLEYQPIQDLIRSTLPNNRFDDLEKVLHFTQVNRKNLSDRDTFLSTLATQCTTSVV